MTQRAFAARLAKLKRKVLPQWAWNVPLLAWPKAQRDLLFAVLVGRPRWRLSWPPERDAWLCRAINSNPHVFPDKVLAAIAFPAAALALPAPPLLLPPPP
jgi:hypothetical protein